MLLGTYIYANGNTNIYSGLEKCLNLLRDDYSSGERIASIILLSDGYDNYFGKGVVNSFKNLLENTGKTDYVFTLHSFGYGDSYDYELLNEIALIKDGSFFNIAKLSDVGDAFLKIYGSLSTVVDVNIELKIQSKFNIIDVYGKEDMHNASITNDTISSFNVKLIQVIYGKKYDFVLLVDIPYTTPLGTEVLNAKVSKLDLFANYLWDGKFSLPAYEEYIRCIVVIFLFEGYNKKSTEDIDNGMEWIRTNYNGTRNWVKELDAAKADLMTEGNAGKANLNIVIVLLQLPLRDTPVLPIVVVPNFESIIISLIGFPFLTATWYLTVTDWPKTLYFPILNVLSADILYPKCLPFSEECGSSDP